MKSMQIFPYLLEITLCKSFIKNSTVVLPVMLRYDYPALLNFQALSKGNVSLCYYVGYNISARLAVNWTT